MLIHWRCRCVFNLFFNLFTGWCPRISWWVKNSFKTKGQRYSVYQTGSVGLKYILSCRHLLLPPRTGGWEDSIWTVDFILTSWEQPCRRWTTTHRPQRVSGPVWVWLLTWNNLITWMWFSKCPWMYLFILWKWESKANRKNINHILFCVARWWSLDGVPYPQMLSHISRWTSWSPCGYQGWWRRAVNAWGVTSLNTAWPSRCTAASSQITLKTENLEALPRYFIVIFNCISIYPHAVNMFLMKKRTNNIILICGAGVWGADGGKDRCDALARPAGQSSLPAHHPQWSSDTPSTCVLRSWGAEGGEEFNWVRKFKIISNYWWYESTLPPACCRRAGDPQQRDLIPPWWWESDSTAL